MHSINRQQLLEQLNWRYATKQYDRSRKISPVDWSTLEEALVLSPSSLGLQPWTFLVIEDPAVRAQLQQAAYGQPQLVDASHLVVFATKVQLTEADIDAHLRRTAEVRGIPVESLAGLRAMATTSILKGKSDAERRAWIDKQAYIALGNLVTSAALLGIDATPMEGFDKQRFDEILGLAARGLTTSVIAAVGYRSSDDKYAATPKVRFAREQVVQHV